MPFLSIRIFSITQCTIFTLKFIFSFIYFFLKKKSQSFKRSILAHHQISHNFEIFKKRKFRQPWDRLFHTSKHHNIDRVYHFLFVIPKKTLFNPPCRDDLSSRQGGLNRTWTGCRDDLSHRSAVQIITIFCSFFFQFCQ